MLNNKRLNGRTVLAFAHDLVASAVAWFFAYALRFNLEIPPAFVDEALRGALYVVPLQSFVFWRFGLYRGIWRYASLNDLKRILVAVGVGALAVPVIILLLRLPGAWPRSVLLLDPILLVLMMGGSRLLYRAWKEHNLYGVAHLQGEPVLVLGAGDVGAGLVRELERSREWRVVGLLDDNAAKHGRLIHGVRVLGRMDDLPAWATRLGAQHVIMAMPSVSHGVRRRTAELATGHGIKVLTVPSFGDLMSGKVTVSSIRRVEVDDLLGRDPVVLDDDGLHELLTDASVLVTGAGGSIGSELCRQILKFAPKRLVLLEQSEFALYRMEQELASLGIACELVFAVGDVKNARRVDELLARHAPAVIFHAAAYKHVPLMEDENAAQAVENNAYGTYVLARTAAARGVAKLILISTDKAVNPTNVMGASKRLAEMILQGLQPESATQFVMVRFGNVLGSAGSVIPKFKEQIEKGGPVTVTHPDITRYFMSIPEAAQLVLQAGLMGRRGEIFVLDMGEPVRIVDLARDMIRLSGFSENEIRIEFTGLRPGEKLFEELLADNEQTLPTPHPKLRIARARDIDPALAREIETKVSMGLPGEPEEIKRLLRRWVPDYCAPDAGAGRASLPERVPE